MGRKGISFTLTIVVAGVILLMTALSIITLGGSSITQFFTTITGQQEGAVTDAEVQQACRERAESIQQEYCSAYVQTSQYDGNAGEWTPAVQCGDTRDQRKARPPDPDDAEGAYERTASQESCRWGGVNSGHSPTVSVGGDTFNCVEEGHIGELCPVQ